MDTDLLAPFARLTLADTPAIAEGNHSDAVTGLPSGRIEGVPSSIGSSVELRDVEFDRQHVGVISSVQAALASGSDALRALTPRSSSRGNGLRELDCEATSDGHEGKTHSFAIENMSLSPTKAPSSLLVRDARVPPTFLSLPAEIRLAICGYVFASVLNTIVLSRRDCYPVPPILRSCRLLRAEALDSWGTHLQLARPKNDEFKGFMEAQWLERLYNCAHQQGTREMMLNMVSSAKKQAMQHGRDLQILERLIDWVSDEEVSCFSILTAEDWEDTKGSFRFGERERTATVDLPHGQKRR